MRIAGVLPEDAPDPRAEAERRLDGLDFRVMGLPPQPALEDYGAVGFAGRHGDQLTVSIGYTLWRNPADRGDPINLAELDEQTRFVLEQEPPWPRPPWILEFAQRARYPQLSEAVRTTWSRDRSEYTTLRWLLVDHVNHILMNQFREELGLPPGPTPDTGWRVALSAANPAAATRLDGVEIPAMEIDTDPFVYAVGVELRPGLVTTAVVPRVHLPYVDLAFATRPRTSPAGP